MELELNIRNQKKTIDEVKADILAFCYLAAQDELKNSIKNNRTEEIRRGRENVKGYLLTRPYGVMEARLDVSKAALMISALGRQIDFANVKHYDLAKIGVRRFSQNGKY